MITEIQISECQNHDIRVYRWSVAGGLVTEETWLVDAGPISHSGMVVFTGEPEDARRVFESMARLADCKGRNAGRP